jgi:hypothetical protein
VSSSLRRGALAAAAIAFSIASLAACGAGNDAQTLEVKPDNAAVSVGVIKVQNALVITQPLTESGTEATGPAVISATVFNTGKEDSVSVEGAGSATLSPAKGKGKLVVPAFGSLVLGGKGNASAALSDSGSIPDGNAQKITFTLSTTGAVSLSAFVVPADSYFSKWGPTAIPSAAPGASATTSGSPKPGKSTSATPTDSASASATATESATTTG